MSLLARLLFHRFHRGVYPVAIIVCFVILLLVYYIDSNIAELQLQITRLPLASPEWSGELHPWHERVAETRINNFLLLISVLLSIYFLYEVFRRQRELQFEASKAFEDSENKSRFVSLMTHELKTPITSIMSIVQLLLKSKVDEMQMQDLQVVQRAAKKQLTMINDILDYSKLQAKALVLDRAVFSMEEVKRELRELFQPEFDRKGIVLLMPIEEGDDRKLMGDKTRLQSILGNLISNGLKFTEQGKVELRLRRRNIEAEVVHDFAVVDTGIGIPKEKKENLFRPFHQLDASITRKYGGTGLGLTIASTLVEMMGGRLELDSEEGAGARFHFSLGFQNVKE